MKNIKNYENYKIYIDGSIWSIKSNKFIKHNISSSGYLKVGLYNKNGVKYFNVHRLIAENFIKNKLNKPQVNHINGIKTDNRIQNLEWVTISENAKHAWNKGLCKISDIGIIKRKYNGYKVGLLNKKIILDNNTGIYYDSIKEAAFAKNLHYHTLRKILSLKKDLSLVYA
jgi:hypothetical protein